MEQSGQVRIDGGIGFQHCSAGTFFSTSVLAALFCVTLGGVAWS
jgi:hypothetical protein